MAKKTINRHSALSTVKFIWSKKILLTSCAFVLYLAFFDKYNFITQYKLYRTLSKLEHNKENYISMIQQAKIDKKDLEQDYEKFARERYFMSRTNEDIFVIENSNEIKKR